MASRNKSVKRSGDPAALFAALGDETRMRIVLRLSNGQPASITALTAGSRVTRQAVTKHLCVMQKAGLARRARHGRESRWQLERRRLDEARHYLEMISRQWDDALARLKKFVEDGTSHGST
ncbi:MAG TPA: metalloregulator ArsR/SmtB family transcription factor [Candidatus Acidoferrum sp.]|nr:metalloregulator ArsR/SmtB family transcription factor [Candidatus Acidoferrum sp.]